MLTADKNFRRLAMTCLLAMFSVAPMLRAEAPYSEKYRPQFHFSPLEGWIGDPNGLIRYQNKYHLFWWGHATSADLVHWIERPKPMRGDLGTFAYFSGSVVVDEQNTSGFGSVTNPPMIAVYTAHEIGSDRETQCLSTSLDYNFFDYYPANPILDDGSVWQRDPDVFWHEPTSRWVMLVSLPRARKIRFYGSADLKSWELMSEFGPVGARDGIWEVPGLIQLPLDDDPGKLKWVLFCGTGPNKVQYFVGEFDGTRFTMDESARDYFGRGLGLPGRVMADFESADFAGWTKTGTSFGAGPTSGQTPYSNFIGYLGHRLASSSPPGAGDAATGTLTSPKFKITGNCINFLISGGIRPSDACLNLVVDGKIVRTATGHDSEILKWNGWNVADLKGRIARLQLVDQDTGSGGHIHLDHIVVSDVLFAFNREHANWVDWGSDFYASRVFRNYDDGPMPNTWMGWMGNWDYAREVPTSWGRGAESIPRTIKLVSTASGYTLRQQPIAALQVLRGKSVEIPVREIEATARVTEFQPRANTYEIEAVFDVKHPNQQFGLNLCVGESNKVVIGYNTLTSTVYLDRRNSGEVSFSSKFPNLVSAPITTPGKQIKFQIFVDQSSIEVFINDGAVVLTSLIFPEPTNRGVELFATGQPATVRRLWACELLSIWK